MDYEIPDEEYDAIVISDYDKGFITQEKLFEIVSNSNFPVFVDSKKTILPESNCFIKINDNESKLLKSKNDNLIITRGSAGAEYNGVLYPGEKVSIFDVVGAGDTFLSALVYFYLECGTIEKAIPYANKAASIAVSNFGTYVLTEEDINAICN
jgi:D-beta-D-heptose 7-phosphate kinase/D-beta-D-heptose 1-phosphate adenosyltransferase